MSKTILVTGGAGYVGSHAVLGLMRRGYDVVVVDNMSKGHRELCPAKTIYEVDLRDAKALDEVFGKHDIDAVLHFSASSLVGESVENPLMYYDNNVGGAITLLDAMNKHGVKKLIFSSTAATYGIPKRVPILEDDEKAPINPYGASKLAIEGLLHWCDGAYGIKSIALRYFNVAGADEGGTLREEHNPETHIIPIILQKAKSDDPTFTMYGDDYNTPDGSCVRDYIHVTDLIDAHVLAYEYLCKTGTSDVFNLGSGGGYSNLQIYEAAKAVTGVDIKLVVGPRRPGDPDTLIASSDKAKAVLGWEPKVTDIQQVIRTAWNAMTATGV